MYPILLPKTAALIALFAALGAIPMTAIAEDAPETPGAVPAAERALSIVGAKKEQKLDSQMGFTSTSVYHTLADQKAVIAIHVDNATDAFATKGTVFLFEADATEEGIAKWINNQRPCGVFRDPAEPIARIDLPEGGFSITAREVVGQKKSPRDESIYIEYKVKVAVKAHHAKGQFQLEAFEDEATVLLKPKTL